jgi:8-hydroxy-5-deazaflavin:NADPH oxidoreductase
MRIAIIGSGNVGSALGKGWSEKGHQVTFGIRNPDSPKSKKALEIVPAAKLKSIEEAIADSEIVIISVPPDAVMNLISQFGDITDKIFIDTTNSIRTRPEPYPTVYHAIKKEKGHSKIVKCFNSTGFENMLNPLYNGAGLDMFAAGDDKEAKDISKGLAKDLGFEEYYDFGGDDKVELLEKFAFSWINLAIMQGHGRGIAFKLLKR